MPATKPIRLSTANLEAGSPEVGTSDLTELRTLIRPFPKDVEERDCYRYLVEQMRAAPGRSNKTKAHHERICRRRFHIKAYIFDYCWSEASDENPQKSVIEAADALFGLRL